MSESYPKSKIWPYVLSGMLLFVYVLRPFSGLAPELRTLGHNLTCQWGGSLTRNLVSIWMSTVTESEHVESAKPKIVGYDPLEQVSTAPRDVPVSTVAPAPTWNVSKVKVLAGEPRTLEAEVDVPDRTSAFVAAGKARQRKAVYVWQPPPDWEPTLIEPSSTTATTASRTTLSDALTMAEVSEPVAKLEPLRNPRRRPKQTNLPGFPESVSLSSSADADDLATKPAPLEVEQAEPTPSSQPSVVPSEPSPQPQIAADEHDAQSDTRLVTDQRYLHGLLQLGAEQPRLAKWSRQLTELVREFRSRPVHGDKAQRETIALMSRLANYPVDVQRWTIKEQELYWRIRYAMQRRTDVWQPLLDVATFDRERTSAIVAETQTTARALATRLKSDPATAVWAGYLALPQLATSAEPSLAAEATLVRLRSPSLTSDQRAYLGTADFRRLESQLRATISQGITAERVAQALETYEDQADATSSKALLATLQRFATGPQTDRYLNTIRAIDTHYRNANFRVSVSEDLINRFVPAMHEYAEQVNDTILGASVRGQNATWANLSVRLMPDAQAIRLGLLAKGQVQSNTESRKGPVVFYNRGQSQFAADKQLEISPQGIFLGQTETRASTGNRVVGMRSDWDEVPLLGWLVRTFAWQQHDEQRPFLRAEVLRRVRRQASTKLDVEVQRRMARAEQQVQSRLVEPLQSMDLDPRAMEMRTTEDRAIFRARLAGPLQMGSHTPRPKALLNSKMSVQIHQTAANNFIDQLQLGGRRMTLGELATEISNRVGVEMQIPEKRKGIILEFAERQPLEFHFRDGKVEITFHFAELDNGRETWENFSVRGFYRADVRRMDVELIRDGSIELITESLRLRDQIALRSIFTKVFDANQRLDVLRRAIQAQPQLQSLEVIQLVIRDGWISASIGENTPSMMASEMAPTTR